MLTAAVVATLFVLASAIARRFVRHWKRKRAFKFLASVIRDLRRNRQMPCEIRAPSVRERTVLASSEPVARACDRLVAVGFTQFTELVTELGTPGWVLFQRWLRNPDETQLACVSTLRVNRNGALARRLEGKRDREPTVEVYSFTEELVFVTTWRSRHRVVPGPPSVRRRGVLKATSIADGISAHHRLVVATVSVEHLKRIDDASALITELYREHDDVMRWSREQHPAALLKAYARMLLGERYVGVWPELKDHFKTDIPVARATTPGVL